ncbi:MAG: PqqD family protein [Planctomycetota bacterium]
MYTINAPRMIHETIDKETVAIDTESGAYFSITGSGNLVMQMLDQGADVESLSMQIAAAFAVDPSTLRPLLEAFVAELLAEALIVPVAGKVNTASKMQLQYADDEVFTPPALQKFTDMSDLLLMDPIHQVGDAGWPHRA